MNSENSQTYIALINTYFARGKIRVELEISIKIYNINKE